MNDKILELLTQFAAKFGKTAEHLWGVLLKQAQIDAMQCTVLALGLFTIWAMVTTFCVYKGKANKHDFWGGPIIIISLFILPFFCIATFRALTAFLNPEFWALQQILGK